MWEVGQVRAAICLYLILVLTSAFVSGEHHICFLHILTISLVCKTQPCHHILPLGGKFANSDPLHIRTSVDMTMVSDWGVGPRHATPPDLAPASLTRPLCYAKGTQQNGMVV